MIRLNVIYQCPGEKRIMMHLKIAFATHTQKKKHVSIYVICIIAQGWFCSPHFHFDNCLKVFF